MESEITVRPERPGEADAIGEVVRSAFLGMPYADGDEAEVVERLRARGVLSVSLVAERGGVIVGQVAFSPARPAHGASGWYALGPLAVVPACQGLGVGSDLVRAGLEALARLGASGCILTGERSYYARFGFELSPGNVPPGESPRHFMVKLLRGRLPDGPIHYDEAFGGV